MKYIRHAYLWKYFSFWLLCLSLSVCLCLSVDICLSVSDLKGLLFKSDGWLLDDQLMTNCLAMPKTQLNVQGMNVRLFPLPIPCVNSGEVCSQQVLLCSCSTTDTYSSHDVYPALAYIPHIVIETAQTTGLSSQQLCFILIWSLFCPDASPPMQYSPTQDSFGTSDITVYAVCFPENAALWFLPINVLCPSIDVVRNPPAHRPKISLVPLNFT